MSDEKNEGEGSRSAAKEYNEKTRTYLEEAGVDVQNKAREAREALEGPEGEELREAEEKGRSHAKEEDPQVKR
jgi:hypothetical protein